MKNNTILFINGERHILNPIQSKMMLADYLRYDQNLIGTKIVCAEGDCGACTVLQYHPYHEDQAFKPINSCITPMASLHASALVTVDKLAYENSLHESQKAMVECHASQCGYCTPGFVMAMTGLLEKKCERKENTISEKEAKNAMTGNLCRCTGYAPIIEAATQIDLKNYQSIKERFLTQDILKEIEAILNEDLTIKGEDFEFYASKNLKDLLKYKQDNPQARILASSTDLGVVHNKRKLKFQKLISLQMIESLYQIDFDNNIISVGARVSLEQLRRFLEDKIPEFSNYIDIFASPQIKNIGTLIGNIANASPIGDTPPPLLVLDAIVVVEGINGKRDIALKDFFLDYRKTAIKSEEIITHLRFELPKNTFLKIIKTSNRKDLDISTVNFAFHYDGKFKISAGGVAAIPLRLKKTEDYLNNNSKIDIDQAVKTLHSEFNPITDVRASSSYRRIVVENFFKRTLNEYKEWSSGK